MLIYPIWKKILILLIVLAGIFYAVPNFISGFQTNKSGFFQPGQKINLGLDLQGGAYLLLEIQTSYLIKEKYNFLESEVRDILREAAINYADLQNYQSQVSFVLRNKSDHEAVQNALRKLAKEVKITSEGELYSLVFLPETIKVFSTQALDQSVNIIRKRIDELGNKEAFVQPQGTNRIIVQAPGTQDPEQLKRTIGKTAKLTFHIVSEGGFVANKPQFAPLGTMVLENVKGGGYYIVDKRVQVAGDDLEDAQPSFNDNQQVVSFRFNSKGARQFGKTTQENAGKSLAIVLDNKVISAPRINEPILGGSGIISGNFNLQEAGELALLLRAGALVAPIEILEERSVGAGLGADSIESGKIACIIGLIGVIFVMLFWYKIYGLFANIALVVNIVILMGVLSALQATMSLPGIAGIVLTLGMAVDANVLIYERIKEEVDVNNRQLGQALVLGFDRAFATIFDSNITTLLGTFLLFSFGSGPIKGFAVTLSIGIITSMFTSIMITRLLVGYYYQYFKPKKLNF